MYRVRHKYSMLPDRTHLELVSPACLGHYLPPIVHYEFECQGPHSGSTVQVSQDKEVWDRDRYYTHHIYTVHIPSTFSVLMFSHRLVSHICFSSLRSYFSAADSSPVALPSSSPTFPE